MGIPFFTDIVMWSRRLLEGFQLGSGAYLQYDVDCERMTGRQPVNRSGASCHWSLPTSNPFYDTRAQPVSCLQCHWSILRLSITASHALVDDAFCFQICNAYQPPPKRANGLLSPISLHFLLFLTCSQYHALYLLCCLQLILPSVVARSRLYTFRKSTIGLKVDCTTP